MQNNQKLISLKEAAQLSGYSADYIGQLIRSGKIEGKQVYCNIAWMTTEDAVLSYKNGTPLEKKSQSGIKAFILAQKRKIQMEMDVVKLFFASNSSAKPLFFTMIIAFLLLNLCVLYYVSYKPSNNQVEAATLASEAPSF